MISSVVAVAAAFFPNGLLESAQAQQVAGPPATAAPASVSFEDPVNISSHSSDGGRFSSTDPTDVRGPGAHDQVELQLSASGDRAGVPVDVAFAHRDSINAQDSGHNRSGSEFRIGQNLVQTRDPSKAKAPTVYAFVASDNEALTWQPGQHFDSSSLALQDQVEVGDRSAGVTYESHGVQTSLAYVERRVYTRVGAHGYSTDENFAGLTVTLRH